MHKSPVSRLTTLSSQQLPPTPITFITTSIWFNPTSRNPRRPPLERPALPITLSQLIAELQTLGINVISPHEEISRDAPGPAGPPTTDAPAPAALTDLSLEALLTALSTLGIDIDSAANHARTGSTASSTTTTAPTGDAVLTGGVPRVSPLSGGTPAPSSGTSTSITARHSGTTDNTTGVISGFVCASCNAHNLLRPSRETWYVVTVGRQVGVFQGWHTAQPLVSGVSGTCYRKYPSHEEALAAFEEAMAQGNVAIIAPPAPPS
ncbi:hypothetical protein DFP72DRAFT_1063834 [Ephemerocybe angulata]|uniref:Ribonuclease H1 N-terminal domain-containing protein n=1 Tax=Ephemerocybe angulata TaxID=980116 RepID=A0A8H6I8W1_9AGAR|nr:hypothetical protein DFP72DRAFT_1063834 [Tulosesus angulatus]